MLGRWASVTGVVVASLVLVATRIQALTAQDLAVACSLSVQGEIDEAPIDLHMDRARRIASDEFPFFRVTGAVLRRDGGIAVGNAGTNEIPVFDGEGRRVSVLGGRGGGPSEFSQFYRLYPLGEDAFSAADLPPRSIKRFNTLRGFRSSVRLEEGQALLAAFAVDGGNGWVAVTNDPTQLRSVRPGPGRTRMAGHLRLFGRDGRYIRDLADVRTTEWTILASDGGGFSQMRPPFAMNTYAAPFGSCVLVGDGADSFVRVLRLNGSVVDSLELVGADTVVSEAEWNASIDRRIARVDPRARPRSRREYNRLTPAKARPTLSRIIVDDRRRVWVEGFHHWGEDAPGWWVFARGGALIRWLPAPPGVRRLLDVRYGRAAVVNVNQVDEETIIIVPIERAR